LLLFLACRLVTPNLDFSGLYSRQIYLACQHISVVKKAIQILHEKCGLWSLHTYAIIFLLKKVHSDPELALHLREMYEAIIPGYHMNKKHWNTIILDGSIPVGEIFIMIDDSYDLVVKGLTGLLP